MSDKDDKAAEKGRPSIRSTAVIAGAALGSAAIAAALMFANKRKAKNDADNQAHVPSGEQPETD